MLGRFLSVDPVETDPDTGDSFNRYKYAANNPYKYIDPDGRHEEAFASLGEFFGEEVNRRQYRNATDPAVKARLGEHLARISSTKYGDHRGAQQYRLEADTLRGAPAGVIYLRINPKTGETYVGQAASPEHFTERQKAHNGKLGVQHDYQVLERAKPGQQLDVAEESHIRLRGGLKGRREDGGGVVNKRHQMSDPRYRGAGGSAPPPIGTRIRRR